MDDDTYLIEDAKDRRAALQAATALLYTIPDQRLDREWLRLADDAYRWLQRRDSLRAVSVQLVPGTPRKEGSTVTTIYQPRRQRRSPLHPDRLQDAKNAAVPLAELASPPRGRSPTLTPRVRR